jgi:hypothetical protein
VGVGVGVGTGVETAAAGREVVFPRAAGFLLATGGRRSARPASSAEAVGVSFAPASTASETGDEPAVGGGSGDPIAPSDAGVGVAAAGDGEAAS